MAKNQIRIFLKKIYKKLKKVRFALNKKAQKVRFCEGALL